MWQQDSNHSWVDWQAQENICKRLQHDQVDWAALAQQWISMKDTSTGFINNVKEPLLPTPPQPPMVRSEDTMEIEEDIENPLIFDVHHKAPEPWQQWDNRNEQQVWHPNQHWTAPGCSTVHHVPPPAPPQSPAYWTAPVPHFRPHQPQPALYVPSLLSLNVPPAPAPRNTAKPLAFLKQERQSLLAESSHKEDDFDAEQEDIPMIDAVKRKQLPAWLREGLEKMEQEKIKKEQIKLQKLQQLENLRKQKEKEEDTRKKEAEEKGLVFIPGKSKFESDSESDTEEPQNPVEPFKVKLEREREALKVEPDFHEPIFKTKEEVFQEMLIKVKRIMTEVLLDVTTVEINSVAKEELSRAKKKASNSALVKGQALQSLSGKLGLGLYDNSDSEESDEEIGVQKESHLESSDDDDDKIKHRIQRYKSSFATKELEIERQNRELEQRTAHLERKFLGQESSAEEESSEEERGNERQVQSNHHGSLDQRAVSEEQQVSIKEEKQERKKVSRWGDKAGKNNSKKNDKLQEEDNLTKIVSPHSVKQEEPSSPREVVRTPNKSEKEHKIRGSSRERRRSETERYRSDVERSERYRSDTERSERYRSDAERSERYRSDAERSERHRSDAERSERYRSDAERSKRYRSDVERSKRYHSTRESRKSSVARERSISSDEDRRYKKDGSDRIGSRRSHRSDRYSERYSRRSVSRNRKRKRLDSREKRRERSRRIQERSKSRDSRSSTKREQDKNRDKKKLEERKKTKRRRSPSSSSSSSSDSTSYSSSSSSSSEESSSESSSTSASSRLKGRK
ncbi:arginine/serine-rich protein PNISR-like isoform X2 [Artemia franciscana]|uniref:arginine/serine-rich protein PNISR-like isoform X2 n=1 Tax=Artemia franciscana TaxID=6661 RepID=UPI0032DBE2B7